MLRFYSAGPDTIFFAINKSLEGHAKKLVPIQPVKLCRHRHLVMPLEAFIYREKICGWAFTIKLLRL
jgi:hypothetical protein